MDTDSSLMQELSTPNRRIKTLVFCSWITEDSELERALVTLNAMPIWY